MAKIFGYDEWSINEAYYATDSGTAAKGAKWANRLVKELGMTKESAAAVAGNIFAESRFMPDRIQGHGYKTGTLKNAGSGGYSWAQWTYGARKRKFRDYILKKFKVDLDETPATDIHAYSFLKAEMQDRYMGDKVWYHKLSDFNTFKKSKDIAKATTEFMQKYEQPKNQSSDAIKKRIGYANLVLSKMQ